MIPTPHVPVLKDDILKLLLPDGKRVARVIDGTLGAGGHTRALLEAGAQSVLGLDVDPQAIAIARKELHEFLDSGQAHIVQASYTEMDKQAAALGWDWVDGIVLDFGVSSMQLDTAERGFAFRDDGPLDMRFDPTSERPPASKLVNYWDESELSALFFKYGEEPDSRRIAWAIVEQRPFETTGQLAETIKQVVSLRKRGRGKNQVKGIHPATRTFQALRIAVNDELGSIERVLPIAIDLLKPGGRLAVISFHSLEDRIVKRFFKDAAEAIVSPPGMMLDEKQAIIQLITRKPITANDAEVAQNPRSRSAKLRVAEKL
jgi:16S rRNA (cytosine1402-N4)-methyltransferase